MTNQEKLQKLIDVWGGQLKEKILEPVFFINEICGIGQSNAKLNKYQEDWINYIHDNKRVSITAFRSSGKTECLFVSYPIFKAFTTPGWMGIVVSDKEEQAKEILTRIKQKIESNPILSTSIPKHKSTSWSKTEITLSNTSRILSKPYTERLRGWHVDWAGFDEAGEYRDLDIFESNAYAIITAKDGNIVVVGTPKSELDLLHNLRKNTEFKSYIFGADERCKIDGEIKTLWQIRYPKYSLAKKKKEVNNNLKFSREFLCRVLSSGDELFPYGIIEQALDYDKGFDDRPIEGYSYYMGLDFALSGESGADYSVYCIMNKCMKTNITRVVRIERYKGLSYEAQKLRIRQLNKIFKPAKVIADEGSFGKAFVQELKMFGVPVKGFNFHRKKQELLELFRNAFDLNFTDDKVARKALPVEQRKFFINYGKDDIRCQKVIDELIKELLGFGVIIKTSKSGDMTGVVTFETVKRHDDLVMACALAYCGCHAALPSNVRVLRGTNKEHKSLVLST